MNSVQSEPAREKFTLVNITFVYLVVGHDLALSYANRWLESDHARYYSVDVRVSVFTYCHMATVYT